MIEAFLHVYLRRHAKPVICFHESLPPKEKAANKYGPASRPGSATKISKKDIFVWLTCEYFMEMSTLLEVAARHISISGTFLRLAQEVSIPSVKSH